MNAISWNCRGLGATSTVHELKDLCRRVKPSLLFLMETRAKGNRIIEVQRRLHFQKMFSIDSDGSSGGLCLFWNANVEVEIVDACQNYIHTLCRSRDDGLDWDCTFVYGNPIFPERRYLWERLRVLHIGNSPWMCIGDFNELLSQAEKVGARPHCQNRINLFRAFVDNAELMDMDLKGSRFTWLSNPRNGVITKEKIDRLLVNWSWRRSFPNAIVSAFPPISSDHSPLVLNFQPKVGDGGLFKYEAYWEDHPACHQVISDGWQDVEDNGEPWRNFVAKIKACKRNLKAWSQNTFKNASKEISKLKRQLQELMSVQTADTDVERIQSIKGEIQCLWAQEEKYWGLRSRLKWLKWGDKNSNFFHATTVQRRDRNRIQRLQHTTGEWIEGQEEVTGHIMEHFRKIYQSDDTHDFHSCLDAIPQLVDDNMNAELCKEVSDSKIKEATFSLGALKAPGCDGFNGLFYQNHWDVVGPTVCEVVKMFFLEGTLPADINETIVALIPKIPRPEEVGQFRPISCCNFVYKIITEVIVLRLRKFIDRIISPNQSAFISGRLIQDNIIVTHEILHALKHGRGIGRNSLVIKLDLSKAYDRLEWNFLEGCLLKYGFDQIWVSRVMQCVKGATYRYKVNGIPSQRVIPQRGLRQGDPLSPYLFLLALDTLSHMLQRAESTEKIKGLVLGAGAPRISHIFCR